MFLPQKYHLDLGGSTACTFQQNFNPFLFKMTVDFAPDAPAASTAASASRRRR